MAHSGAEKFPDDAVCHAYEGEMTGLVIRTSGPAGQELGAIHCSEKNDRDMPTDIRPHRLAEVVAKASAVFGSREKGAKWLQTPLMALDGAIPLSRLETERGAARVLELLVAIEAGNKV